MRFQKSLVATALIATFALLPGCGAAPALPVAATSAAAMQAMGSGYPVEDINGVGPTYGKKLRKLGLTNHEKLQEATASVEQVQQLATQLGVPFKVVQGWAHQADLMEVKGIGPRAAALLAALGIASLPGLAAADPAKLAEQVGIANAFEPRFLERTPGAETVAAWVAQAQALIAEREAGKNAHVLSSTYGLQPLYVKKLGDGGVTDEATLKAALATKKNREKLAKASGLPYPRLLTLAGKVNMMAIEGVGLGEAELLFAVGVPGVRALAAQLPADLHHRVALANASEPRFVEKPPGQDTVASWVKAAQKLAPTLDEK